MNYKLFRVAQLCIWSFISGLWFMTSVGEMSNGNWTNAGLFLACFSLQTVIVIWYLKQVVGDINR